MHVPQQRQALCCQDARVCIGRAGAHKQPWRHLQAGSSVYGRRKPTQCQPVDQPMDEVIRTSSWPLGPEGGFTSSTSSPGLLLV